MSFTGLRVPAGIDFRSVRLWAFDRVDSWIGLVGQVGSVRMF